MNTKLELTRPLAFLDVEATGVDPATDKIVSLAIVKMLPGDMLREAVDETFYWQFNPERSMSAEVIAIHGITNEAAAQMRPFLESAALVHAALKGCDLSGFNLRNYDIPIIWEELYRAKIEWDLEGVRVIDAGTIFKKKEERTLSAAMQFYCGKTNENAHHAMADTLASREVLSAQIQRYADLGKMGLGELAEFSKLEDRVDLAGKIVMKNGVAVYNLRRVQDVPVVDDPGFAEWMLERDFSANTKMHLRRILGWVL